MNAAIGGQIVTQADLAAATAPLATQAQLTAATLALQAQLAAATIALQAQMAAMQAQLLQQMQAQHMPHNAPVIAAAVAIARSIVTARSANAHGLGGVAYIIVPRDDGTLPPSWLAGFSRDDLYDRAIGVIDAMLFDYGLPHGAPAGGPIVRRNTLAAFIGATPA